MPKVTIIMPVYNVKPYLALSMQSVRRQTMPDIQIICVDDGSTDGSGELLDKFAAVDSRIQVIHKENGGVSSAKNAGLAQATGDYIIFFDPDDVLHENACERVACVFDETSADIVAFGGAPLPEAASYVWLDDVLNTRNATFIGFDINVLMREKTRPFAWRTACSRAFLERTGVHYDETISYGEDQVFQFAVFPRAEKTVLISDKLIDYRVVRDGSFMFDSHRDNNGRILEHIRIVRNILTDWRTLGILDENRLEMFEWSVEFLMRDLIARTDEDTLAQAETEVAEIWHEFFPQEFLDARAREPLYADMMQMVFNGADAPSHLKARFIDWRYSTHRLGAAFVAKRMAEHVAKSRLGEPGRKLKNALPMNTKQKRQREQLAHDREAREQALAEIEQEYAASVISTESG